MRASRNVFVSAQTGMVLLLSMIVLPAGFVFSGCGMEKKLTHKETVIAGGPDKFVEVRHVILKGSNFEIGKEIGQIAKRDGVRIRRSENRILNRAKREYMADRYPILYERMKGIADSYGLNIADDSYDFTGLFQPQTPPPGCSVTFYPAKTTENGHNILSRNYDFTTGDTAGRRPRERRSAIMARPYLFEIHPDQGYSSLSICALEYLGGVLDGINSEGLVVAILAVSGNAGGGGPSNEVGMHELMGMRYLLDNCRNVEEAKEALLSLQHYYCFVPCHYIVGDRSGKSFIFEFSPSRDKIYIVDGDGPQYVTNHLVYQHPKVDEFPETDLSWSMRRYKMLDESTRSKEKFTVEEIADINERVAIPPKAAGNSEFAPIRTLWYAQYDLEDLTLAVKFYLGERPDSGNGNRVILEYTPPDVFALSPDVPEQLDKK